MTGALISNDTLSTLTKREQDAALLLAEDTLTDEQIAARVGVTKVTIARWKRRPDFAAAIHQHREEFKNRALSEGFADKRARIAILNSTAQDIARWMAENDYERTEVKVAANGEAIEYKIFDKARYDSLRGALDDIAAEMGDRTANQPTVFQSLVNVIVGVEVDRL